jgi:hypothetical protein
MKDVVRIGSGSGMLFDSTLGLQQMLRSRKPPDYMIFDHLAEATMSPFTQMMQRSPDLGYSTNIVDLHVGPFLAELKTAGVKVVTNAGGLNPQAAARALYKRAAELGVTLRIGIVEGDNLAARLEELRGYRDMFNDEAWPDKMLVANAYFGAFPIAAALKMGADIVLTGRVVDSALTLGPLIHEFGWKPTEYDQLAAGTAAGHLLECGAQATGGTFTDWMDVPDPDNIGFPIAECRADGTFTVTKPEGTGGIVSVGSVAEQLLYEVSDPGAYLVPDVACDFTAVRMRESAPDCVEVSNVRGNAPNGRYKVSGLIEDGWRTVALIPVFGIDAAAKAKRVTESLLARSRRVLEHAGLQPFRKTLVELIGTGETFAVGPGRNSLQTEVIGRVAVIHDDARGATIFLNEALASPTNACAGMVPLGLPTMGPVHRLFSFLMPRDQFRAKVTVGDDSVELPAESADPSPGPLRPGLPVNEERGGGDDSVPLIALAWGRSGDKGNLYNVGVIARRAEYLPHIRTALTERYVADWVRHTFDSPSAARVRRYDVPGLNALNFVMYEALGGGGSLMLRFDCFAKSMGQTLLQIPVAVPRALAKRWDGTKLPA